jgi:general L-amino acid transport system substrate-binding protein
MSLMPKYLSAITAITIALLTSCQGQPTPTPTIVTTSPTVAPLSDRQSEGILERVKQRGKLICGVNGKLLGFSYVDEKGIWSGLDVDYCRAIAAAVLGDAQAVDFKPMLAKDRFTAIQTGEIDVLMRNTSRTLTRDTTTNIAFAPTTFFDGQGMMVRIGGKPEAKPDAKPTSTPTPTPTSSPTASPANTQGTKEPSPTTTAPDNKSTPRTTADLAIALKELADKKVCVETGNNATNLESSVAEFKLELQPIVLPDLDAVLNSYNQGECDAISSEKSQLAVWRSKLSRPADHKILDLSLSKEPLSPALVGNDERWRDVVTWVIYATFYADELGITQNNYGMFKDTENLEVSKFLGTTDSLGIELGLAPDWTTQILQAVGNYSDIYNRNLAPLDIPRGLNLSWKEGGLLYPMPFR